MALTIRPATTADIPIIVEFNRRMALEAEKKVLDDAVLTAGVTAVLADPHKMVYYLAENDGVVVGQIGITTEWSDWRNGWLWWIQSVYVSEKARRLGVFRALYQHIDVTARAAGDVIGLRLMVERENRRAQNTYLSLGMAWTEYLLMQRYPLASNS
jgi:GNAT superfamily N-acetyltransferase